MRDRTLRWYSVNVQSTLVKTVSFRLVNPDAMADACSVRVTDRAGSLVFEGRITIGQLRAVVRDGVEATVGRHVVLVPHDDGPITLESTALQYRFQVDLSRHDLERVMTGLWEDYSDF